MKVLLTNDDGIRAEGLQAVRRALLEVPGVDLAVVAPDGNRSASARSITTRRPLWTQQVTFDDGTVGHSTDGTPVDCVRLAKLGLVDGFVPDIVVAGANHGANLGDDVTYSGTVAAAVEGVMLGLPGLALSQQSTAGEMDFRLGEVFDFTAVATLAARLVQELRDDPLPAGTLLNVNCPGRQARGVQVTRLGRRIYQDELVLDATEAHADGPRRRFHVYGEAHDYERHPGTDLAAIADGFVSVTPLHFRLTDEPSLVALGRRELDRLLTSADPAPAATVPDVLGSGALAAADELPDGPAA